MKNNKKYLFLGMAFLIKLLENFTLFKLHILKLN